MSAPKGRSPSTSNILLLHECKSEAGLWLSACTSCWVSNAPQIYVTPFLLTSLFWSFSFSVMKMGWASYMDHTFPNIQSLMSPPGHFWSWQQGCGWHADARCHWSTARRTSQILLQSLWAHPPPGRGEWTIVVDSGLFLRTRMCSLLGWFISPNCCHLMSERILLPWLLTNYRHHLPVSKFSSWVPAKSTSSSPPVLSTTWALSNDVISLFGPLGRACTREAF